MERDQSPFVHDVLVHLASQNGDPPWLLEAIQTSQFRGQWFSDGRGQFADFVDVQKIDHAKCWQIDGTDISLSNGQIGKATLHMIEQVPQYLEIWCMTGNDWPQSDPLEYNLLPSAPMNFIQLD